MSLMPSSLLDEPVTKAWMSAGLMNWAQERMKRSRHEAVSRSVPASVPRPGRSCTHLQFRKSRRAAISQVRLEDCVGGEGGGAEDTEDSGRVGEEENMRGGVTVTGRYSGNMLEGKEVYGEALGPDGLSV